MAVALQFVLYAATLQTATKEKELPMEEAVKGKTKMKISHRE